MPAIAEETEAALDEGVEIQFLAIPAPDRGRQAWRSMEIEGRKTELGEFDLSGRRRPVPTTRSAALPCDTIILAVGREGGPEPRARPGPQV